MVSNKYKAGVSVFAFAAVLSIFATPAAAQDAQATAQVEDEGRNTDIIVTGSSIRGIAPVGSNLVAVGQEQLEKVAPISVTELVNTVPAISTANATPQAQNAYSYYAPQIHQLAGSGSNSTLALIDGLRMPGGGTQYAQTDPNIIPTPALQRVEVLADGASSIYGSDAVAGVVNFITRETYDGAQVNGRIGFGDNYRVYDINGIWGTTWDTGGIYVAGQFLKQSEITNDKRPFMSRGDYRDIGGSNTNTFLCSPATVRAIGGNGSATGPVFLSADTAQTVANNQAQNGFCNNSIYGTGVPGVQREGVLVVLRNEFSDKLTFQGKVAFNHLTHFSRGTPGTISGGKAFGVGASVDPTQINPFFRAPPGTGFTQESISWVALKPDGDYGTNNYENTTFYATGVLEYEIGNDWTITGSGALARSNSFQRQENGYNGIAALMALNGSPALTGSRNVVLGPDETTTIGRALNPGNALDVWNGLSNNRTSQEVWDDIYSLKTNNEHQNNMWQLKLEAQGPLFDLPAGTVRAAAGGEYMNVTQDVLGLTLNSTGTGYNNFIMNLGPRKVTSGYLEVFIPIISADMEIPLVQSFDLNLSGRYDHYSDWGSTTNPKIAANWQVNDSIKVRGNWASSFVAPPLNQIGDPNQGYLRGATGTGRSAVLDVPVALYPNVKYLPGCGQVTTVCRVGQETGREGLDRSLGAGFAGVEPQDGESWSIGVDLTPTFLPGFTANVTYWTNSYRGGVNSPAQPLIINSESLRDRLFICAGPSTPAGCTDDQIRQFTNVDNGATTAAVLPPEVYFLINRDVGNVLDIDVAGIDAQAQYVMETSSAGAFTLGATLTYFTKFDQRAPGGEWFDLLNTSGYNSQFPSIQTRVRANLGWDMSGISFDLFANYTGSYRNYIQTSVLPVELGPNGNPIGGGDKVRRDLTFDLHASYELGGSFMEGSQIYIDVKNLLDKNPPFYNGNTTGAGVGAWGFNGFVSNVIGRVISLGFRADF